ncbi:MAG: DAK2 domain-containing protein [Treponema sp.]|nr:DAK2 domain-containing protein [Treponema sp.]
MNTNVLTGEIYSKLITAGTAELNLNRKIVNDLNVFPIPDGDTGDNMFMTVKAGCDAILPELLTSLDSTSAVISKGMLLGARGNSGVILSKIFAGLTKGFQGCEFADIAIISQAFTAAIQESYSAVSKPVEGTILTVFRESVEFANSRLDSTSSIEEYFENLISAAKKSLDNTPNLLAQLKEAGVVDSGGAGLIYIFNGMLNALNGREYSSFEDSDFSNPQAKVDISTFTRNTQLEFGYCTEFFLRLQTSKVDPDTFDEFHFSNWLNQNGNSLVFYRDDDLVKVHIHTMEPGKILNYAQQYGEFLTLKIENMMLQHNEATIQNNYSDKSLPHKKFGTVTVAAGAGIKQSFLEMGVDQVINGGQSMNPSSQDFIQAFELINADHILVFPNNSNIIMAANQAKELYKKAQIHVLPAKTIGQGYAAISMLDFSSDNIDTIISEAMTAISETTTGMISVAVRDTVLNGVEIKKDQYLGFENDTIHLSAQTPETACKELAKKLKLADHGLMLLIYGKDVSDSTARELYKELDSEYKKTEIILIKGEQPVYNYIMVLE